MDKRRPGDNAADRAPREAGTRTAPTAEDKRKRERQDGPNYDRTIDGERAIPNDDLNSANDG